MSASTYSRIAVTSFWLLAWLCPVPAWSEALPPPEWLPAPPDGLPQSRRATELDKLESEGLQAHYRGDYAAAEAAWQRGLQQAQGQDKAEYVGRFLLHLVQTYEARQDYPKAAAVLQQAVAFHRARGDKTAQAYDLADLARVYQNQGRYAQALEAYQQALALHRELDDRKNLGLDWAEIAGLYEQQGRYAEALDAYRQSLEITRADRDQTLTALNLFHLAQLYQQQGRDAEALAAYQEALALHRELGDTQGVGFDWLDIGRLQEKMGQPEAALAAYREALAIHREFQDKRTEAHIWGLIAQLQENAQRPGPALEAYQKALDLHREVDDVQGVALDLQALARLHEAQGRSEAAIAQYQAALPVLHEMGDAQGLAFCLRQIGGLHDQAGRSAEALDFMRQALDIYRHNGDARGESWALHGMGVAALHLGRYAEALDYLQQTLARTRALGDRRAEGNTLGNLGLATMQLGDYAKAIHYFQQALPISREFRDTQGEAATLNNLGMLYANLGQYAKALEHYQQALQSVRALQRPADEANALANIGWVHVQQGEYSKALETYQQSLALHRKLGDRRGESINLSNLGSVYAVLGQYALAQNYVQDSLELARAQDNPEMQTVDLAGLGALYALDQEDYAKAGAALQEALEIARKMGYRKHEGSILANLGGIYLQQDEYRKALDYLQPADLVFRELGNRQEEAINLAGLGKIHERLENYPEARRAYQASLGLAETLFAPDILWLAQRGLAAVAVHEGQPEQAVTHYQAALDTIESLRAELKDKGLRLSFMQGKLYVYDEFLDLLSGLHQRFPERGYERRALEIFERKQGRLFLEEIGESGAQHFAGVPDSLLRQEDELAERLLTCRRQFAEERGKPQHQQSLAALDTLTRCLGSAQAEQDALREDIRREHPAYYAIKYPSPAKPEHLQQAVLRADEALLVYAALDQHTLLWVVTPQAVRLFDLPPGAEPLAEQVRGLRQALGVESVEGAGLAWWKPATWQLFTARSHALYRELLPEAAQALLKDAKTLYVVPTGALYRLPFEALLTRPGLSQKNAAYLVREHAVAYLSSASLLATLREAQERRKQQADYPFLAFADPVYRAAADGGGAGPFAGLRSRAYRGLAPSGGFQELPDTAQEAQAIAELLAAPDTSQPLQMREAAARSKVMLFNEAGRLEGYRYLLFATHGILPGEINQVTQPALVLSQPDPAGGDGYLTMSDVFGLRLNADLVNLSACNTGMGEETQGEGVMGLTRAFMYAGTPAVVVTLWAVDSAAARALGVGLFSHLRDNAPPAAALRQAKLAMLEQHLYRHPYFWASSVVFGKAD